MREAPMQKPDDDLILAQRCICGDANAHCELRDAYYDVICRVLLSRGASETEAADVAGDVFTDCIVRAKNGKSLLRRYGGRCSLKSWLLTVATNRFIDRKRRSRFRRELNGQEEEQIESAIHPLEDNHLSEPDDSGLIQLLHVSLRKGIDACENQDYVMLCLVYLYGVTQREVAELWDWHESKVSRILSRALKTIGTVTMESVRIADPELKLSWDDFVELIKTAPDVFHRGKMLQDTGIGTSSNDDRPGTLQTKRRKGGEV
jgi:RNA polymerase sigma factor (sigma-70 family)